MKALHDRIIGADLRGAYHAPGVRDMNIRAHAGPCQRSRAPLYWGGALMLGNILISGLPSE